jgi:CHAD domain-containing protein
VTNNAPSDHLEVEWQFSAEAVEPVERWLASANIPGYVVVPARKKELTDRYLDTEDWRIHRAGFTCRVREKGDAAELTLKSMADAQDAMRSRREVNEPILSASLESASAAQGTCGAIIRHARGLHPLRELFTVHTSRTTFDLSDEGGLVGEIAVDATTVPISSGEPVSFSRVEVEVPAECVDRARRFVGVLIAATNLDPVGTSKFGAALAATGQEPLPSAPHLGSTRVDATMAAGDVAYAILRKQFGAFLANEPGTRIGEDIEALHDMRVAARRLRAAMSAFAAVLPATMERMRAELGWVAATLGEVRDLDVQLERMDEWRHGLEADQAGALNAIEEILRGRWLLARKRMLVALDSRRYERFAERFAGMLQRGAPRTFLPGREPVLLVAPGLLRKRYRQVRRLGDPIRPPSPPSDYHTLRIGAKKLRYGLEFVGPIYGKPALAFSARVTALQDVLGLHQDAEIAVNTLREMATARGRRLAPETILAMGAIAERYRRHGVELRSQFPAVWKPLIGRDWTALIRDMERRQKRARVAIATP